MLDHIVRSYIIEHMENTIATPRTEVGAIRNVLTIGECIATHVFHDKENNIQVVLWCSVESGELAWIATDLDVNYCISNAFGAPRKEISRSMMIFIDGYRAAGATIEKVSVMDDVEIKEDHRPLICDHDLDISCRFTDAESYGHVGLFEAEADWYANGELVEEAAQVQVTTHPSGRVFSVSRLYNYGMTDFIKTAC